MSFAGIAFYVGIALAVLAAWEIVAPAFWRLPDDEAETSRRRIQAEYDARREAIRQQTRDT